VSLVEVLAVLLLLLLPPTLIPPTTICARSLLAGNKHNRLVTTVVATDLDNTEFHRFMFPFIFVRVYAQESLPIY